MHKFVYKKTHNINREFFCKVLASIYRICRFYRTGIDVLSNPLHVSRLVLHHVNFLPFFGEVLSGSPPHKFLFLFGCIAWFETSECQSFLFLFYV